MVYCLPAIENRIATPRANQGFARSRASSYSNCSRLSLEHLESFEIVKTQFQAWGVTLENAIALQPSNAAYPTRTGETLLMAAPRDAWMEFNFERPVRSFTCRVTSSQPVILSAYDRHDNLVVRDELAQGNLADSNFTLQPNALLSAVSRNPNIARISLYAFDGQLTVSEISFCF